MKKSNRKIVLIGDPGSSFVKDDLKLIDANFRLIPLNPVGFGKKIFFSIVYIFKSIWMVFHADVLISWFADYYSVVPCLVAKILRKPFITIAGGFDVIYAPEYKYGAWINWHRKLAVKLTFYWSYKIWCVSKFTQAQLTARIPGIKSEVQYLGIDTSEWIPDQTVEKKKQVLTVALTPNMVTYSRKGVDRWLKVARQNQHYEFIWIGINVDLIPSAASLPPNVRMLQFMPQSELIGFYKTSGFFLQPSRMETFGKALLEAMVYGCFPIVSEETSLPEIAGPFGIVIAPEHWDSVNLVSIEAGISYQRNELTTYALNAFPSVDRENRLVPILNSISYKNPG
ncbi:MAG: glycosyltransferase [Bacteroidetes bacterium]|nr:glycosyltransferase [Bacteroidota bacterium]